jgi:nucleoside-diphosphate-sugar epimerase
VYGPRQSFDVQSAYGGVISLFLERLAGNMDLIVYGDGEQTRDFVYVQDVVEANMLALNAKNVAGDFFNIGSGVATSVNEVAEIMKASLKKEHVGNTYAEARLGEIKHSFADISKARRMMNYAPRFSLRKGLADLVRWYLETGSN